MQKTPYRVSPARCNAGVVGTHGPAAKNNWQIAASERRWIIQLVDDAITNLMPERERLSVWGPAEDSSEREISRQTEDIPLFLPMLSSMAWGSAFIGRPLPTPRSA